MKMLGWVHRKFRQSWVDSGRDFSAGSSCYCLAGWPSPDGLRHPTLPPETARAHQVMMPPETDPPASNPIMHFDGLLSIGTFGSPIIPEPVAITSDEETTAAAAKEIAAKETEVATESELTTIMVELERVLAAESEKERSVAGDRKSSSSVSARPSVAGKLSVACPLQDFLFGSPVEAAATAAVAARCRDRRTSLGELFLRGRDAEEAAIDGGKWDGQNPAAKMSAGTKRMFINSVSAKTGRGGDGAAEKIHVAVTKFQNIMRIFNRKIHPENYFSSSKKKLNKKAAKNEIKRDKYCSTLISKSSKSEDGGRSFPAVTEKAEESDQSFSSFKQYHSLHQLNPTIVAKKYSKGNGEHWIKTDADYLVLEF